MSDNQLPNPFAPPQPETRSQQPVAETTQSGNTCDPDTAEVIRAIEHELRHPQLCRSRPFIAAPHLLDEFRKRIESGE